jgi:hypothetical protein
MSRQNKQLKNAARAKQLKGGGPKSTTPKHGKNPANRIYTAKTRSFAAFQERNKAARKGPKGAPRATA